MKIIVSPGMIFGRLSIVAETARGKNRERYFACRCSCGGEVTVRLSHLRSGGTQSCGCLQQELAKARKLHGMKNTAEYDIWVKMRGRCRNPNDPNFSDYGGRGIEVCARWESFAAFYADMGPRPSKAHAIDRLDNDGPYSPGNCAWRTRTEQANNKRNNRFLTANGERLTVTQWARKTGLPASVIRTRVVRLKWPAERAVSQPVRMQA